MTPHKLQPYTMFMTTPARQRDDSEGFKNNNKYPEEGVDVFNMRNDWIRSSGLPFLPLAEMANQYVFFRNNGNSKDVKSFKPDHHFQCMFVDAFEDGIEVESDGLVDIKMPPSGDCRDIINLNLVMIVLNHIMI